MPLHSVFDGAATCKQRRSSWTSSRVQICALSHSHSDTRWWLDFQPHHLNWLWLLGNINSDTHASFSSSEIMSWSWESVWGLSELCPVKHVMQWFSRSTQILDPTRPVGLGWGGSRIWISNKTSGDASPRGHTLTVTSLEDKRYLRILAFFFHGWNKSLHQYKPLKGSSHVLFTHNIYLPRNEHNQYWGLN